jgi:hypothetical protein
MTIKKDSFHHEGHEEHEVRKSNISETFVSFVVKIDFFASFGIYR